MSHLPIRPITSRLLTAAGVAAAVCAIALPACAATPSPAASGSAAAIGQCTGSADLSLKIPDTKAAEVAGLTNYTLDFTNTSKSTCSVSGYPYVSMVNKKGGQLGSPAGHGLMTIAPLVRLAPGATAHTVLTYRNSKITSGRGCGPVATASRLRVFVAGQKLALYTSFGKHACSRAGQVYLTVTEPYRPGAGSA